VTLTETELAAQIESDDLVAFGAASCPVTLTWRQKLRVADASLRRD
jgi:hypothetical protein